MPGGPSYSSQCERGFSYHLSPNTQQFPPSSINVISFWNIRVLFYSLWFSSYKLNQQVITVDDGEFPDIRTMEKSCL